MSMIQKNVGGKAIRRMWGICILPLTVALALSIFSCSEEKTPPPETEVIVQESAKAKWAEFILRPRDSLQHDWVGRIAHWPDTVRLVADSTARARLDDLTFAFDVWIFKNLDWEHEPRMAGLRLNVLAAATYIPDYQLIKLFNVDSVLLYLPGETEVAGRKRVFPARRKFLEGVWQVEFLPRDEATIDLDFPEGTRLKPEIHASWQGKGFIFELPDRPYEYIRSAQPKTD